MCDPLPCSYTTFCAAAVLSPRRRVHTNWKSEIQLILCTVPSPFVSLAHGWKWRSASNLTGFQRSYRRLGLRRGLRDGDQPLCKVPSTAKAIWATGRMALDRGQEVPTFCTLRLARPCLTSTGPRCLGCMSGTALFNESEDVINVLLCCATGCYAMLSYCINGFHGIHFGALPPVGTLESSTIECTCMYSILVIGSDGSLIQHHLRQSRLAGPRTGT